MKKMFKINKAIKTLVVSDFLLQIGWGFVGPIFAIFLTKQIQGGNLRLVGFVASIYWITKSIVQPFIAHHLDKNHGEKDDFVFLITGMYVSSLIPFGYIFATQPWHILTLEGIRGLAMACVVPTWYALFTRHVDRGREAFSWSIESTGIGFAAAFAGAVGGILATAFGFHTVFILLGTFGVLSSSILFLIRPHLFGGDHFVFKVPPIDKPPMEKPL
jgi:MFS family permease